MNSRFVVLPLMVGGSLIVNRDKISAITYIKHCSDDGQYTYVVVKIVVDQLEWELDIDRRDLLKILNTE